MNDKKLNEKELKEVNGGQVNDRPMLGDTNRGKIPGDVQNANIVGSTVNTWDIAVKLKEKYPDDK